MRVGEEAAIDAIASSIMEYSFEFLERQTGKVYLMSERISATGYDFPEIYWVAVAKHYCFHKYRYFDPISSQIYQSQRFSYALRGVPRFPKSRNCPRESYTSCLI